MHVTPTSILDYSKHHAWGDGSILEGVLSVEERAIWDRALGLQDRRGDNGHAEVVTLFADHLSREKALPEESRRIVVLAAILHDIGWSAIENIRERFSDVVTRMVAGDGAANAENTALRDEHQHHSVRIASELLDASVPDREKILDIISDHDTRRRPPSTEGTLMWDADMLWRMTVPGYFAAKEQLGLTRETWIPLVRRQLSLGRTHFQTSRGLFRGELELKASIEWISSFES